MSKKHINDRGFTLVEVMISLLIIVISIGVLCTSVEMYTRAKLQQEQLEGSIRWAEAVMDNIDVILGEESISSATANLVINPSQPYGVSVIGIPLSVLYAEQQPQLRGDYIEQAWHFANNTYITREMIKERIDTGELFYKVVAQSGNEQPFGANDFLVILTITNQESQVEIYYQTLAIKRIETL